MNQSLDKIDIIEIYLKEGWKIMHHNLRVACCIHKACVERKGKGALVL